MIVDCQNITTVDMSSNPIASAYYADVRKYEVLTKEKERELLEKYRYGSEEESKKAKDLLIASNQRFVISFAKKFATNNNIMDIISEANIGLMMAIERFDVDNNHNRLITYAAFWMRRTINNYLASVDPLVIPSNSTKVYSYATKGRNRFWDLNGRYPTNEELKEFIFSEYNVVIAKASDLDGLVKSPIDETLSFDDGMDFNPYMYEFNRKTSTNNIEEVYNKEYISNRLDSYLSILTEREKDILKKSYGIGCDNMTNNAIADEYNLHPERIRQIIRDSLKKLRKYKNIG